MTTQVRAAAGGPPPTGSIDQGFAFFEGRVVPIGEANVNIATHALNYGTGCFEGIRCYWNEEQGQLYALKLREHYQRLLRSCRILKINLGMSVDDICAGHPRDAAPQRLSQRRLRAAPGLQVRSDDQGGPGQDPREFRRLRRADGRLHRHHPWPAGDDLELARLDDNAIPARGKVTGGYVNTALAMDDALAAGFDETIMLTRDGHVAEGELL